MSNLNITNNSFVSAIESIMSHEEKAIFPISNNKDIKKDKDIHGLNKIISRVNNFSDTEILKNYVSTINTLERILELKLTLNDELDTILNKYTIDIKSADELRKFIIIFSTIGLQKIEKENI